MMTARGTPADANLYNGQVWTRRPQPTVVAIVDIGGKHYKVYYYYEADDWELYCSSEYQGEANNLIESEPEIASSPSKKIRDWLTQRHPTWKPKYPITKKSGKSSGPPPLVQRKRGPLKRDSDMNVCISNRVGLLIRWMIGAAVMLLCGGVLPALAAKPNIILIMADDSAVDNYGCYGSTFFETPRLDALARSGIRFTHCYSEPVCTASRVKIMTGRDNVRNYVAFGTLDKSETTFGTMLKNAGYATAVAGKWQLHGGPSGSLAPECGFDTYCLWNYPGTNRSRYWNPSIVRDGQLLETNDEDYGPDIFTDYLIDFIDRHKDRPFFAYYPMVLVHSPFLKTPDSKHDPLDKQDAKLANFRDMTAYADKCVGRIVDSLEEMGLRDNTVVIYTTDNGTGRSLTYPYQGEQRNGEKAYATEGGSHAPLIVNAPGMIDPGRVCDDMVDFSDFLPTLAEIAGAELPEVQLDGRSFWPQCQGKRGNPRAYIFQYYYPKFRPAAKAHGTGVNDNEIIWAQNQEHKLYADGTLYAVADRYEKHPIPPSDDANSPTEAARQMLRSAIDSMPPKGQKLAAGK